MWTLVIAAALAEPRFEMRYVPLSRGDLAWVADERTTGTAVGEFDGFVDPVLSALGGAWVSDHLGFMGSIGMARLTTTQWTGTTWRQRHWGVVRPAVEARWAFGERVAGRPCAWASIGMHGDVPSARDTSNGYTPDEQESADVDAYAERLRLGGIGGRVGFGVDWRLGGGLVIGGDLAVEGHWGVLHSTESSTISSWLVTEPALHVAFEGKRRTTPGPASGGGLPRNDAPPQVDTPPSNR